MTKNNGKKQPKAVGSSMQKPGKGANTKRKTRKVQRPSTKALKGCVDPFCNEAVGCKLIAPGSARTFTYTVRARYGVSTDAAGNGCLWLGAGTARAYATGVMTGALANFPSPSPIPEYDGVLAVAPDFRVVCAGVHIYSSANTDESKGIVAVATTSGAAGSLVNVPINDFDISSFAYEEVTTDCLFGYNKKFAFRKIAQAEAATFQPTDALGSKAGWNDLYVSIAGGTPNSTLLQCEIVYHLELQPQPISITARMADPPKPFHPSAPAAINEMTQMVPFGVNTDSWGSVIERIIESPVAASFAEKAMEYVAFL